jgi:hypothetical protein
MILNKYINDIDLFGGKQLLFLAEHAVFVNFFKQTQTVVRV